MDAQRTLRRQISCVGIGLHSGNKVNLTLKPAVADFGIRFRRTDLGNHEVPATVNNLAGIQLATGLAINEVSVETVEHLLAALVSVGIDNVIVELNSPEVPIMDGSAAPFIYLIHEAGVKSLQKPRKYLKIVRPIALSRGDKRIALYPSDHFKVTYSISYDHPLLRHQSRTIRITADSFPEDTPPARPFPLPLSPPVLGGVPGVPGVTDVATTITQPSWVVVLGSLLNVAFGALLIFGGQGYWRWQKFAFLFAGGSILISAILLITSGGSVPAVRMAIKKNGRTIVQPC